MLLGFAVVNIGFSSTPWIRRPDIRLFSRHSTFSSLFQTKRGTKCGMTGIFGTYSTFASLFRLKRGMKCGMKNGIDSIISAPLPARKNLQISS
jgi:hypothetical protein